MDVHGTVYTCYAHEFDAPPTKRLCSCGVDLLTLSDINIYRINKHLTGIQAQVTGHRQYENTNAQCVSPGTHYSV